jgi:hypothetical protein
MMDFAISGTTCSGTLIFMMIYSAVLPMNLSKKLVSPVFPMITKSAPSSNKYTHCPLERAACVQAACVQAACVQATCVQATYVQATYVQDQNSLSLLQCCLIKPNFRKKHLHNPYVKPDFSTARRKGRFNPVY